MDLKGLVNETLRQIAEGSKGASDALKEAGVKLNAGTNDTAVEFDVGIYTTRGTLEIAGSNTAAEGTRIKFAVPVRFPQR